MVYIYDDMYVQMQRLNPSQTKRKSNKQSKKTLAVTVPLLPNTQQAHRNVDSTGRLHQHSAFGQGKRARATAKRKSKRNVAAKDNVNNGHINKSKKAKMSNIYQLHNNHFDINLLGA